MAGAVAEHVFVGIAEQGHFDVTDSLEAGNVVAAAAMDANDGHPYFVGG
jgi:hypothetical protein